MRKKDVSKEEILKAIQKYPIKKEAAASLNVSSSHLRKLAKRYGISYPTVSWKKGKSLTNIKYPFVDREWMITHWVNTSKSMHQLAVEYGIPESILECRRSKYNLSRTSKIRTSADGTRILSLEDPRLYYLLGLTVTDGYIVEKHNAIEISLVGEDERILLSEIQQYFAPNHQIVKYGNAWRSRITYEGLALHLLHNFNISSHNKTYKVKGPTTFPSEDAAKAYIRGCWDGDGCITSYSHISLLTASEALTLNIRSIIKHYTGVELNFRYEWRKNRSVKYPIIDKGGKSALKVLKWMYSLENCFKLNRKYEQFLKLMI